MLNKSDAKAMDQGTETGSMNAVQLLTRDHSDVTSLFEQYEKLAEQGAASEERQRLARTMFDMLAIHAAIEEEIFYPAVRELLKGSADEILLDEAEVEHTSAKALIAQLATMDPNDDLYDAKVQVLGQYVERHVREEEGEMFRKTEVSGLDLAVLGRQLQVRKAELVELLSDP